MEIRILGHPGNPAHNSKQKVKDGEISGVQTSDGDKFHGDIVDLTKAEAGLLIAAGRAEEVEAEDHEEPEEKKK